MPGDAVVGEGPAEVAVSRTGMVYVTDSNGVDDERFVIQFEPA
jgi:hypothetical protein